MILCISVLQLVAMDELDGVASRPYLFCQLQFGTESAD
jgi:hypothetical protein